MGIWKVYRSTCRCPSLCLSLYCAIPRLHSLGLREAFQEFGIGVFATGIVDFFGVHRGTSAVLFQFLVKSWLNGASGTEAR